MANIALDSAPKSSKRPLDSDDPVIEDLHDLDKLLCPPVQERSQGVVTWDKVFWFHDGSVILEAGGVSFRVHGGVLSYHSKVFRDLIYDQPHSFKVVKVGSGDSVGDTVAHLEPVTVKLSDESGELRLLLHVVLLGDPFCKASVQLPFATVATLARLAKKYQFEAILDEGLKRIKSCFTDSLKAYDMVDKRKGSDLMTFVESDAIAAVAIARLTNTPSILPLALYNCCQLDPVVITSGVVRANGIVDRLSPADRLGCLRARTILCNATHVAAHNILKPTCQHAYHACVCVRAIKAVSQELWRYEGSRLAHYRALQNWDDIIDRVAGHCCQSCITLLKTRAAEERRTVWVKLPTIFGVPYTLAA